MLDTGILLLAIFTLELEMDYPSETSLCTVPPLPDRPPLLRFFLREGGGTKGFLERIIPSSNCPSKLTDKVRRIVHSNFKIFHFQIKTYYLSDANHRTVNPSRTNDPSLVWKRPFPAISGLELGVRVSLLLFHNDYFKLTIDISMGKIMLEVEYFIKRMIYQMLKFCERIAYFIPRWSKDS